MAGPLAGYTVIELANFIAGPFCGMLLADLGADVIKIEVPGQGDHSRGSPPFVNGEGAGFMTLNRNKRSLALNLKAPEGREILLRLADSADVILENFRPGTVADLGIDEEAVWATNPRLVYCHVSGFGQTGPYRERAGLDLIAQGMSGLMSITGEPGRPPVKSGVPIADLATALFASNAIVSALLEREKSGRGQSIDASLYESAMALAVWESSLYFATGEVPGPLGSAHRASSPYRAFRTRDGYVTVGGSTQKHWTSICKVLGLEALRDDPRFVTNAARKRHDDELAALLEEVTVTQDTAYWLERLEPLGVPAGPLYTYEQAFADRHTQAREVVASIEHPRAGRVRLVRTPLRMSRTTPEVRRPAPLLGEHSTEILAGLGYDQNTISALVERGVIGVLEAA